MGVYLVLNRNLPKKKRFGTCSKDCYGSCVFIGEWDDYAPEIKFISAKPLKKHPFTNGFFCDKYNQREDLIYHSQRIKNPLIREGVKGSNQFIPSDVTFMLEIIARKLLKIKHNFGPKAILAAFNAGNYGLISRYGPLRFFEKLGASITTGGICNEGGCAGLKELFGTYSTTNPFQINNPSTKLIVVWGSDVSNRNVHAYHLIRKAHKKDVNLIVIDSRKTKIAQEAEIFINTKPGTDHILAQAIMKYLIETKSIDLNFLKNHVDNYKEAILKLSKFDLESRISFLDHEKLHQIVDFLVKFKHHTIFNVGYGVQKDFFGGKIVQAIALIQILLGNFGKPGTGLIYSQSDFNERFLSNIINYITKQGLTQKSKVLETDLIKLGENLASEKFKMLFIYNFNPASSLPNQNQVKESLMRKDLFIVVLENFLNETTKFADIVIPSKFDLESYDLIAPYYIPGLSINEAGPCPYQDCFSNYDFFRQLALKIGFQDDPIFNEDQELIYNKCLDLLPLGIQKSINEKGYYILFKEENVPFKNLKFHTPNKKIQLQNIKFDFGGNLLKESLRQNEFFLLTPSHKYFIHSQFAQIHPDYLKDFQKVFLCFDDIKRLGYSIGEKLKVSNKRGSSTYELAEDNSLYPGIAMIYSGSPLNLIKNQNVNIFISDVPEELGLSGAYNSAKVFIVKL